MKRLYVLYDGHCAICRRCRDWLARQATFVALEFLPLQSPDINRRFPGIEAFDPRERLIVIADDGSLYRGASAWVMCLWALKDYREYSCRLADPILLPFARVACELLSQNRYVISRLIFRQDSQALARDLAKLDSLAECHLDPEPVS
jgi:predicted DCC family thiol-disulfide oxidoreductase YuxK